MSNTTDQEVTMHATATPTHTYAEGMRVRYTSPTVGRSFEATVLKDNGHGWVCIKVDGASLHLDTRACYLSPA